jgi:hypothetical protein
MSSRDEFEIVTGTTEFFPGLFVLTTPHLNPSTGTQEFSIRDPDGYYVSISAL